MFTKFYVTTIKKKKKKKKNVNLLTGLLSTKMEPLLEENLTSLLAVS